MVVLVGSLGGCFSSIFPHMVTFYYYLDRGLYVRFVYVQ